MLLSTKMRHYYFLLIMALVLPLSMAKKAKDKPEWAKKDIRDFTDADMERLLDQWEVSKVTNPHII